MQKHIPFDKLSKKKQRELNAKRRGSWHGVVPVTKKTANGKAYNRKKTLRGWDDPMTVSFYFAVNGKAA